MRAPPTLFPARNRPIATKLRFAVIGRDFSLTGQAELVPREGSNLLCGSIADRHHLGGALQRAETLDFQVTGPFQKNRIVTANTDAVLPLVVTFVWS